MFTDTKTHQLETQSKGVLEQIKSAVAGKAYNGYHEEDAAGCKVLGITLSANQGNVGRDAFAVRANGSSANVCIADGAMADSKEDTTTSTERVEAEILTHSLLNMPLSQSDGALLETNHRINAVADTGGDRSMLLPFAALHKMENHIEWLGNSDTYIIAFIPEEVLGGYFGKYKRYSVKVLHHSNRINYSSAHPNYRHGENRLSGKYFQDMGGEADFPRGTIFMLSTDGGIVVSGDRKGLYIASATAHDHIQDPHPVLDLFSIHEGVYFTIWDAVAAVAKYLRGELPSKEEWLKTMSK